VRETQEEVRPSFFPSPPSHVNHCAQIRREKYSLEQVAAELQEMSNRLVDRDLEVS
jgi:hypothetical protein